MKPILNDPQIEPTQEVLQNAMGDNFGYYISLLEITSKYGLTPQWLYYNDGKSWLCKMLYKKMNVLWFSVWANCSKATFYFTEKDIENIAALPISDEVKSGFFIQKPTGKLLPMVIAIAGTQTLSDIDTMIEYKLSKR